MNLKKFLNLWLPVVFWCGVIFAFSSIPTLPKVEIIWWDFILKKSAHMVEYGVLYFLIFRALTGLKLKTQNSRLRSQGGTSAYPAAFASGCFGGQAKLKTTAQNSKLENQYIWLFPFIFGLLYAISDEYHQSFVPGRTGRVMDVGFDMVGMILTWWRIQTKLS